MRETQSLRFDSQTFALRRTEVQTDQRPTGTMAASTALKASIWPAPAERPASVSQSGETASRLVHTQEIARATRASATIFAGDPALEHPGPVDAGISLRIGVQAS